MIVADYGRTRSEDVSVRTYSEHADAGDPLRNLGGKDITIDVDFEALQHRVRTADSLQSQEAWLLGHGIEDLVAEGKSMWEQGVAAGSLDAIRGLSRAREVEALCDPLGLGGFFVAEWVI